MNILLDTRRIKQVTTTAMCGNYMPHAFLIRANLFYPKLSLIILYWWLLEFAWFVNAKIILDTPQIKQVTANSNVLICGVSSTI